ncbi:hypothetical protein EJ04DRAFT_581922 [Polyplosphaeria fusca]|uniref:Major facilitator superfamily (MFS) profile domain-containing protein n=1 Tax=Polyplosphaeria fusca TaxID=682080 RepID=A0A9P4QHW4_9PLEO|nr:hypothetical protein EJ04DRAFT_581922 [Polyplosphaeria fusca]
MARYLGLRGKSLGTAISTVCGLCFLCFGYAQGVLGGLLTVPAFLEKFPQLDNINNTSFHNARYQGITVATWNLGCFASAILTIFIGDVLGRRRTLLLGLAIWVIGEVIQCTSYSFDQFIAGRFIAGFGNGFNTATVPAYQAECVKSHRKGTILMISAGVFVALGLALSYWFSFALAFISNASASWRIPIAAQVIFALVAFVVLLFLPESPRWLILTGREQQALEVLAALNNEDIDGPEIRDEFLQIKDAILIMASGGASSVKSNTEKRNLHRVVLAYFVQVFQQMSGINLFLQYIAVMLATQTSYTGWVARLLAGCAATEYFLASFVAVVGIDRFWGRRSLMMFGASGMCLCMVLLTVLLYLWQVHNVGGTNIAATVFLFAFATFFAIGWQGMAWLYQVEVVPLRIRGPANALSTSANWLINFLVVFITPIAFHSIGYKTYIIFACTNCAIVPLIYFFYPETAYRSLEEVDKIFHIANECPGNPWLNVVKIAKQEPLWFGRKGNLPFDYEKSDWHKRHMDFQSDTTLRSSRDKSTPPSSEEESVSKGYGTTSPEGTRLSSPGEGRASRLEEGRISNPSSAASQRRLNKDLTNFLGAADNTKRDRKSRRQSRGKSFTSTKSAKSERSIYSSHSANTWQVGDLVPPSLRISSRPGSGYSARTAASERAREDASRGVVRTSSGRVTYLPDGMDVNFAASVAEGLAESADRLRRSVERPGSSRSRAMQGPREAGRGA